jgi:hypothetical protein
MVVLRRVVVHDVRGHGFIMIAPGVLEDCEAYACNKSNSSLTAGFATSNTAGLKLLRCISHDNTTSNSLGFLTGGVTGALFDKCIADSNGSHGFFITMRGSFAELRNCESYNNGGDGVRFDQGVSDGALVIIENSNFIKNVGYGINNVETTLTHTLFIINCGFGAGVGAVNGSGSVFANVNNQEIGSVVYPADVTPWVDPANGDFRINIAEAKGTGKGGFLQTASGYAGTVSYPDIGAAQHEDTGGDSGGAITQAIILC